MFKTVFSLCLLYFILLTNLNCSSQKTASASASNEVIYHVFLRSFADSNGDGHGDLQGLRSKLGYLQDLGITSLLLLPINSSLYYHNYFSDDFEKIDPEFGAMGDYLQLVKDIHERGMKIYLDMETQYITEDHLWWKDSYNNPASKYTKYLLYNDAANTKAESIIFNLTELPGYDGTKRRVTTVNLLNKDVLDYNIKLFHYFIDPNKDGKFDDGADGFRMDHAMDDLDAKGRLTGLFQKFWTPLITQLKKLNPKLMIIAEQADWGSWGSEYFEKAAMDRVFAFHLQRAFLSFDKTKLENKIDSTFANTPPGKQQVVFVENHDMFRSATLLDNNVAKQKIVAALNLLVGGVPAIYYGQELGMYGKGGFGKYGMTDANDIPMREAFEWNKSGTGKDMALWYKNSGPWWDSSNVKPNDGISYEEQKNDTASLYNYYKTLMRLRKTNEALQTGSYNSVANDNDNVFSFSRNTNNQRLLVIINLSDQKQQAGESLNVKNYTLLLAQTKTNLQDKLLCSLLTKFKYGNLIDNSMQPYSSRSIKYFGDNYQNSLLFIYSSDFYISVMGPILKKKLLIQFQ